jgi:membrane associated rhomboid family serine protease
MPAWYGKCIPSQNKTMFPIGDDNSDRTRTPYVNYLFILANILVFIFLQDLGRDISFTFAYSAVPAEILTGHDVVTNSEILVDAVTGQRVEMPGLQPTLIPVYLTLLTSLFMHGGIAHIAGNMLYLWVFGDNLENVMGHARYFIFYLLCGVLASLSHVFATAYLDQSAFVPSLGASGAISGVLAGYTLLFPTRRVRVWFILGFWPVPAFLAVGLWFVFQVINGVGALGGEEGSGIAYAAHIGGFIAGLLLVKLFARPPVRPAARRGIF